MERHEALVGPVERFLGAVHGSLVELAAASGAASDGEALKRDAVVEASNILAGFIDADGVHTDDELWAYLRATAPHDDSVRWAGPDDVRAAGIVTGQRAFLEHPSPMFDLLVDADARDGGARSWAYFRAAMDLGHTVASIDVHTSQAELDALSRYRTVLLDRIRSAGIPRPPARFFDIAAELVEEARRRIAGEPPAPRLPPASRDTPSGTGPLTGSPTDGATAAAGTASEAAVEPLPPARPTEELLAELDELVGLDPVKAEVRLVTNLLIVQRLRRDRGLPTVEGSRHLVFTGNPGTGKTTVARLLAEIYRSLEVVERGHLVETDRSALVAGFVGQTATKTRAVIESAIGGVLLIDEAYALARGNENDFGREAIDTLVKMMEDLRDDLVIIAAGYPAEMATFIAANPGLTSRFPKTIHFPDYTSEELADIFAIIAEKNHYQLAEDVHDALVVWFDAQTRDRGFGNGRLARNLFEAAVARQASRLVEVEEPSDDQLVTLTVADVVGGEDA